MNVLILGGTGWIGSNIVAQRPSWSWTVLGSKDADLTDPASTNNITGDYDLVINSAGFYGGLVFNQQHQQEILYKNLSMTVNIWNLVQRLKPTKFINIGSACLYPKDAVNFMNEGLIGSTNYHDSIKFSAMSKHIQYEIIDSLGVDWEYLILSNVYGPGEHLSFDKSHFVGSLIKKIQSSDTCVKMLGTGTAIRDFIYIQDTAEAICRYAELDTATCSATNISSGTGTSIFEMTEKLINIANPSLDIEWGDSKDNGVEYKVLDNSKMLKDINYVPDTTLTTGLQQTWDWFKNCEKS